VYRAGPIRVAGSYGGGTVASTKYTRAGLERSEIPARRRPAHLPSRPQLGLRGACRGSCTYPYSRRQVVPPGPSSRAMPRSARVSRMRSARAKSRAARASRRSRTRRSISAISPASARPAR